MASATPSHRSNHGSISSSTRRQREDDAAVLEAVDVATEAARAWAEQLRPVVRADCEDLKAERAAAEAVVVRQHKD